MGAALAHRRKALHYWKAESPQRTLWELLCASISHHVSKRIICAAQRLEIYGKIKRGVKHSLITV